MDSKTVNAIIEHFSSNGIEFSTLEIKLMVEVTFDITNDKFKIYAIYKNEILYVVKVYYIENKIIIASYNFEFHN